MDHVIDLLMVGYIGAGLFAGFVVAGFAVVVRPRDDR
jgi:hypothetical protein